MDGEPCSPHPGCAASAALVPGPLKKKLVRDSSMGSRLIRVYRALVALALRTTTAQSIFSLDAAFQDLVTAQQPWVAPQLPTGGDVSYLKPVRSTVSTPDQPRNLSFTHGSLQFRASLSPQRSVGIEFAHKALLQFDSRPHETPDLPWGVTGFQARPERTHESTGDVPFQGFRRIRDPLLALAGQTALSTPQVEPNLLPLRLSLLQQNHDRFSTSRRQPIESFRTKST